MDPLEPREPCRFSLDGSLGRLARWLRLLGHDAAWERGDPLATAIARSRAERRILLTRSRDLPRLGLSWPPEGGLILLAIEPHEQLIELARRWPIFRDARLLSRCADCNRELIPMAADNARNLVPPYVARTQSHYRTCPCCRRIFWTATHAEAIRRTLKAVADAVGQPLGREFGGETNAGPDSSEPARED